jgi:hypothetical protein
LTKSGFIATLLIGGICASYLYFSQLGAGKFDWFSPKDAQYNLLTQAFLAGSAHLLVTPPRELLNLPNPQDPVANRRYRLHDTALYQGKYYSVYGPTPVLTTFGPYRLLTGADFPTNAAAFVYAAGGFLFSVALYLAFQAQMGVEQPPTLQRLCILMLGLCQFVPATLRRPWFYETAILSGYCFAMAGFYFLFRATVEERRWATPAAGLCFALTLGARPIYVLVPLLAIGFFLATRRRAFHSRELYLLAAPIAAGYLLMGWYNYIRFGSPFETGHRYALTLLRHLVAKPQLVNVPPSLFLMLLCPFHVDRVFPFLHFFAPDLPGLPLGFYREYAVGAFIGTPILSIAGFLFYAKGLQSRSRLFGVLLLLSAGSAMVLIASVGWVTQRYAVDFVPELLLLACWSLGPLWRGWKVYVLGAAIVFSIVVQTTLGIGGVYDDFFYEHPGSYWSLGDRLTDFVQGRKPAPNPLEGPAFTAFRRPMDWWTMGVLDNPARGNVNQRVFTLEDGEVSRGLRVGDTLEFRSSGLRRVKAIHREDGLVLIELDEKINPLMDGWPRPIRKISGPSQPASQPK